MPKSKLFTLLALTLLTISLSTSTLPLNLAKAQNQANIFLDPSFLVDPEFDPGSTLTVTVRVSDVVGLFRWQMKLWFDASIMECSVAYLPVGRVFDGERIVPVALEIDNSEGFVLLSVSLAKYSSGTVDVEEGSLCAMNFQVLSRGTCLLTLDEVDSFLLDAALEEIPTTLEDGLFDNRVNGHISQDQTTMFVHPASIVDPTLTPSNDFTITINVSDVTNFFTWQITLWFDPSIIECTDAYYPPGHVFDGLTNIPVEPTIDNVAGYVLFGCTLLLNSIDVDQGVLCALDFHVLDTGSCDLALDQVDSFLLDFDLEDIPTTLVGGFFDNQEVVEVHDVAVTDVVPSSTSVVVNESVTIDVSIENQGNFDETFDVTAYYDNTIIDTMTDVSLNAGGSDVLTFTWDTTGVAVGTYVIGANVSVVAGEEDVADNSFVDGEVEVVGALPPHDVAVTDVSPSQTSVTVGDSVTIDVTVENQGTEDETFDVSAYYGGTAIDTITTSLNAGASDVLSFDWDTTGVALGTYTISANATVVAGEEDTADNSFVDGEVEVVEALPPHDLAVTDVVPSQTTVTVGDTITIDVTVENQGTEGEIFDVTAYYDGNTIDSMTDVSLNAGGSDVLTFTWDTTGVAVGTYVIGANVSVVAGEEDVADNSFVDGSVQVTEEIPPPPPPPVEGPIIVNWADYPTTDYPCGNPRYPFGGQYHNGQYPVWKNFTVTNNDTDGNIVYIAVQYPEATPSFEPSQSMIEIIFPHDSGWTQRVNLEDNLIEFFANEQGIPPGGCAIVSVQFKHGPTAEDCHNGHVFHVTATVSRETGAYSRTFQHTIEYIDKTPPSVEITFPDATSPSDNYAFIKRSDGYIWLLKPDCEDERVRLLWINGTAVDTCSGINRVEIWINNTYMGDATLSKPIGSREEVSWWWSTDPTNNPEFWKDESWFNVSARAYDNSVNDAETTKHGDLAIPKTNSRDTQKHWLFWIGVEGPEVIICENGEPIEWVPGNGRIDVNGTTGFYPNTNVEIWLEEDPNNRIYGTRTQPFQIFLKNVTADNYGRFYTTIHHLPEIPRRPACEPYGWRIRAVQPGKDLEGVDYFAIIPWITFEDTMDQDDSTTWQTTRIGNVDDTITVYGHGFLPSKQTVWDPYCTVYVRIYYTGVTPVVLDQVSQMRRVFNGTSQLNWDNLEWSPRLSEVLLAEVPTDENGYWSAEIKIPQSYGGLHAIYACEHRKVPDPQRSCPDGELELGCSGWPECTEIEKEVQSAIFDVWPTIKLYPSTAITDQYVTITGEGLPLSRYYKLWKNGEAIVESRDWCLVLDFGPYEQWIFENKRISNNELDTAWVEEKWYPFSFYTPDPLEFLDSPVWKGKLTSITIDYTKECKESYQFHIGSKYLKVPILPPDDYQVMVYYYDKNTQDFTHDHHASTEVQVIKDPINIHVEVGGLHLPRESVDVTVQVDVDGIITDATTLNLRLYRGTTFIDNLSYEKINTGFYVASFECPTEAGDYTIEATATREYEAFTLHGTGMTAFAVIPTLANINATVVAIQGHIVTIDTGLATLHTDLTEINAKVVGIEGRVVTINTTIGTLRADILTMNLKVVEIQEGILTIETDLGTLKENATDLKATIASLHNETVVIHTIVGYLNASLDDINGVVNIQNDIAEIKTDLGDLTGEVIELNVDIATIETEIGRITAKADSIKSDVGLQPLTIGLSLIAALAAIAAAALILKKVYLK